MRRRPLPALLLPLLLAASCATATAAAPSSWRITHARASPWAADAPPAAPLAGTTLALRGQALQGPAPLNCDQARVQALQLPAAGLFEGALSARPDAEVLARALGLSTLPAPALRITCANAGFDLVQADAGTWLLALDQRLWVLSTAPGAQAPSTSPAGVVQRLLERHVPASPRFTAATMDELRPFTSAGLQAAARAWMAQPGPADEVPVINGDPFTDSQEPVLHFGVGRAMLRGDRADVPVQMVDEARRWTLHYQLRRGADGWRIDDVRLRDGTSLRKLLKARP